MAWHQIANESDNAFGFPGEKDLGGGLKDLFQLESRLQDNAGQSNTPFPDEMSVVGLRGGFGEGSWGAQAAHLTPGPTQTLSGGDTVAGRGERKAGVDEKYDNDLFYATPKFKASQPRLGPHSESRKRFGHENHPAGSLQ